MKRNVFVISLLFFSFCFVSVCHALSLVKVEDFSDWERTQLNRNEHSIVVKGGTINYFASGSKGDAYGGIYKIYPGATGILATVNVSEIAGNDLYLGIAKVLGKFPSGNTLYADISVRYYNGFVIRYRLREKDFPIHTLRTITEGFFGIACDGVQWELGKDVVLGLALVGNEVWFYTPGFDLLAKCQITVPITPTDSPIYMGVWSAEGGENQISCTVKDVKIIYP